LGFEELKVSQEKEKTRLNTEKAEAGAWKSQRKKGKSRSLAALVMTVSRSAGAG
jgi:hypothetical protein